jgi:nucleoside-diphosphate-sugar epimerase
MIILENFNDDNIILSVPEEDEKSIEYIARVIARSYDYEHKIKFDKSYSDGQFKKTVSIQRLKKNIGAFKFTNLEEGIQKTVEWFVNKQKNNCRK